MSKEKFYSMVRPMTMGNLVLYWEAQGALPYSRSALINSTLEAFVKGVKWPEGTRESCLTDEEGLRILKTRGFLPIGETGRVVERQRNINSTVKGGSIEIRSEEEVEQIDKAIRDAEDKKVKDLIDKAYPK